MTSPTGSPLPRYEETEPISTEEDEIVLVADAEEDDAFNLTSPSLPPPPPPMPTMRAAADEPKYARVELRSKRSSRHTTDSKNGTPRRNRRG